MPGPDTQRLNRIEQLCAKHGLRMTGQRRTIARILTEALDHPDVEEVHRRANKVDSRISLSTVYRTLKLFADKGILERHEFGAGRGRYEEAPRHHHDHLIDVDSGRVIEFRNEAIERIQERVARELGFRLIGHRLELYGVPLKRGKD
ncbi:MAG TPA: Fur family transcriptional regulator [Hyphomicrobiaceae bacterium]|nr:Fur family transcriptional regulator [Hyphomicrobiaceae bacterium]